ncbi:hypothetical protein H920_10683 [Fukomys damarensis]|uniref:Uncharacterized protein n=1 Tax=Fukomys damarensis TaxID=885580 RepID=A0A091D726_FUKDA|nr:hypothetical protein H920_10683 [Fukomys damarensis]
MMEFLGATIQNGSWASGPQSTSSSPGLLIPGRLFLKACRLSLELVLGAARFLLEPGADAVAKDVLVNEHIVQGC